MRRVRCRLRKIGSPSRYPRANSVTTTDLQGRVFEAKGRRSKEKNAETRPYQGYCPYKLKVEPCVPEHLQSHLLVGFKEQKRNQSGDEQHAHGVNQHRNSDQRGV